MKMVKVVDVQLFELTSEEAMKVAKGKDILVYNRIYKTNGCRCKANYKC